MDQPQEEKTNRAFLPAFSVRTLFWLVTGSALLFVIVGMAARGRDWAWGVSIGIASLLLTAAVHAAWFGIAWAFARVLQPRTKDAG